MSVTATRATLHRIANIPVAGPWCVTDANGTPLCHGASNRKAVRGVSGASSAVKRTQRERFMAAAHAAGIVNDQGHVMGIDGVFRPMSDSLHTDRTEVNERGHIIADSCDGALCIGNMVPQHGAANLAQGDAQTVIPDTFPVQAWASAVRATLLTSIPAAKAARVAN